MKFRNKFGIKISDFKNANFTWTSTYLLDVQVPELGYKPFKTALFASVSRLIPCFETNFVLFLKKEKKKSQMKSDVCGISGKPFSAYLLFFNHSGEPFFVSKNRRLRISWVYKNIKKRKMIVMRTGESFPIRGTTHVINFRHIVEVLLLKLRRLQSPHRADVGQQKAYHQADSFGAPVGVVDVTPDEKTIRECVSLYQKFEKTADIKF